MNAAKVGSESNVRVDADTQTGRSIPDRHLGRCGRDGISIPDISPPCISPPGEIVVIHLSIQHPTAASLDARHVRLRIDTRHHAFAHLDDQTR
jgi:hypothetical protein